jgi:hypothetical protein
MKTILLGQLCHPNGNVTFLVFDLPTGMTYEVRREAGPAYALFWGIPFGVTFHPEYRSPPPRQGDVETRLQAHFEEWLSSHYGWTFTRLAGRKHRVDYFMSDGFTWQVWTERDRPSPDQPADDDGCRWKLTNQDVHQPGVSPFTQLQVQIRGG